LNEIPDDADWRHGTSFRLGEKDNRALASKFAAYTISATLWLLFATAVGILLAYKFGAPDFGAG
jgi:cytochrome c oxidase cbb3-type subunit 1